MKIVFVVALQVEAKGLLEKLENKTEVKFLDKPCFSGKLLNNDVIVAISGIGKVSASLTAQHLIDVYKPDYVFNFGTSGGINESVKLFGYYLIKQGCQFDFDLTEIDDVEVGYIQEYKRAMFDFYIPKKSNLNQAILATADRFSNQKKDIDLITKKGCIVRDMEGTAIAQVCTSNNIPLIALKGVTDIYGYPASCYYENQKKVCDGFYKKIEEIIKVL